MSSQFNVQTPDCKKWECTAVRAPFKFMNYELRTVNSELRTMNPSTHQV
jgi:hypothetical protein